MRGKLRIYLTLDIDPDGATGAAPERDQLGWEGLKLLPKICRATADRGIPLTAFVRSDLQMRDLYGSALAIRERCGPELEAIERAGGEIGWHPHLYRRTNEGYVPLRDGRAAAEQLAEIHAEIRQSGWRFDCVRLGESWHSPESMRALDGLGVRVDSTALPGRRREDAVLSFDWASTPNHPYHPSRGDQRAPGADALRILEAPMSTAPILAAHDATPLRRYLNPAFHPELFEQGIRGFLNERRESARSALVLVFHPGELLPCPPDGLCAQSWEVFARNLEALPGLIRESGEEAEGLSGEMAFGRLSEVLDDEWA